jgi:RNA polymerase-binding transcription factor DksA
MAPHVVKLLSTYMFSFELTCRNCGWRTVCGRDDAIARLRLIGRLRREREPEDELIATLFVDAAPRMTCPLCKEKTLFAQATNLDQAEDWQTAVLCKVCREPIPAERLEAIPATKRCASCAAKAESHDLDEVDPDFCPNCGALIEIRVSRGGSITRYKRVCTGDPPCRL